jgi:hypothetical protein
MKKLTPVAMIAILAIGSLSGCKPQPHGRPGTAKETGSSWGSAGLAEGVTTEALIQSLQNSGFELIEGKTFGQMAGGASQYPEYAGVVALRDTTFKGASKLIVGVGPNGVMWFESRDLSGEAAILEWQAHFRKRVELVEQLAANPKQGGEPKQQNKVSLSTPAPP